MSKYTLYQIWSKKSWWSSFKVQFAQKTKTCRMIKIKKIKKYKRKTIQQTYFNFELLLILKWQLVNYCVTWTSFKTFQWESRCLINVKQWNGINNWELSFFLTTNAYTFITQLLSQLCNKITLFLKTKTRANTPSAHIQKRERYLLYFWNSSRVTLKMPCNGYNHTHV